MEEGEELVVLGSDHGIEFEQGIKVKDEREAECGCDGLDSRGLSFGRAWQ